MIIMSLSSMSLFILVSISILFRVLSSSFAPLRPDQYNALQLLYTRTGGQNWKYVTYPTPPDTNNININCPYENDSTVPWKFNSSNYEDPCQARWSGIGCRNESEVLNFTSTPMNGRNYSVVSCLNIGSFNLKGSVPDDVFTNFTDGLRVLNMSSNGLNGTLPSSIYKVTRLERLIMYSNEFVGTISPQISNLQRLWDLGLYHNDLTGSIPLSLCELGLLEIMYLFNNSLSGTIPQNIGNLKNLRHIGLGINHLTGSIPSSFSELTGVLDVYMQHNSLSGPLPYLEFHKNLTDFSVRYNKFTGSIALNNGIPNLKNLYLGNNMLTGTLPGVIFRLPALDTIDIAVNSFSGSLPDEFTYGNQIKNINVSNTNLYGTIPTSFSRLVALISIDMSRNFFSGPINNIGIGTFKNLECLFMEGNKFSSTLPEISHLKQLLYVDFGDNKFTGTLPALGNDSNVEVFGASVNCLKPIMDGMCSNSGKLKKLYLNGLHQNEDCELGVFSSLYAPNSIPDCIWHISSLQALYFAGNGLTGTFPSHWKLTNVTTLSVSSNRIRGQLPPEFFEADVDKVPRMDVFDISKNSITGLAGTHIQPTYVSSVQHNDALQYLTKINRLSGPLVDLHQYDSYGVVDVVEANLIQCAPLGQSAVPDEDPTSQTYVCGSRDLNIAVVVYTTVFFLFVFFCLGVRYSSKMGSFKRFHEIIQDMNDLEIFGTISGDDLSKSRQLIATLIRLLIFGVSFGILLVTLEIMLYASLKYSEHAESYQSYTYQYTNNISGLYLKSVTPAASIASLYILFFFLLVYGYYRFFVWEYNVMMNIDVVSKEVHQTKKMAKESTRVDIWWKFIQQCSVILIFIFVSFLVNIGYVIGKKTTNVTQLVFLQFAVFVFNTSYKNLGIKYVIQWVFNNSKGHSAKSSVFFAIILMNVDILVPQVATLFGDSLCFKDYFPFLVPPSPIITSYSHPSCFIDQYDIQTGRTECERYAEQVVTVEFYPDPIYSLHCRDAVFENYIPLVLLNCISSAFGEPLLYLLMTWSVEKKFFVKLEIFDFLIAEDFDMKEYVLFNPTYSLIFICEDFILYLIYGLISPFCGIALAVSITSRLLMLRGSIIRYANIQCRGENSEYIRKPRDNEHVDQLCANAVTNLQHFIWPGFSIATLVTMCYTVEMAFDSEVFSMAPPIAIFVFIGLADLSIREIYYRRKAYLNEHLKSQYEFEFPQRFSSIGSHLSDRYETDRESETKKKDQKDAVVNPMVIVGASSLTGNKFQNY